MCRWAVYDADVMDGFTEANGLDRFSLYMFDFGAPVGFRLATRHPKRVQGLVLQNGNAYEDGLGPGMQALKPYWQDRSANEDAIRGFLQLEATRSQYLDGVADTTTLNPDLWELDERYLELPGRDQVMLDLLYDYQYNVTLYPRWHDYMRANQPPRRCLHGARTTNSSLPTAPERTSTICPRPRSPAACAGPSAWPRGPRRRRGEGRARRGGRARSRGLRSTRAADLGRRLMRVLVWRRAPFLVVVLAAAAAAALLRAVS
jgi:pimeloyl-ACP methyl ester carboxylesterase